MAYKSIFGGSPPEVPAPTSSGYKSIFSGAPGTPQEDEGGFGVFDFLGNVGSELGDMVKGITALGGAVVHDVATGIGDIADLDPGEGEYQLDDIAKALPAALAQDYNERYGISKFADGDIWGGLKAVLTGLYERPLSAIGDALLVGKAVTIPAKLGMLGEAGAKVLGTESMAAFKAGARPAFEAATLTGAEGATKLGMSTNPVARLMQRQVYKGLTYGGASDRLPGFSTLPQRLDAISQRDYGEAQRWSANAAFAEAKGLPVLRTPTSLAIEKRGVSQALSHMGMAVSRDDVLSGLALRKALDGLDETQLDESVSAAMGTIRLENAASNATPTNWNPSNPLALPNQVGELASPGTDARGLSAAVGEFGDNLHRPKGEEFISPHDTGITEANKVVAVTDAMDNADDVARRYAAATGGTVEWKMDYTKVAGEDVLGASYVGVHYGIRTPDGQVHDLSVGTPELIEQQRAWSHMAKQADAVQAKVVAAETALQNATPEEAMAKAVDLTDAQGELNAIRAFNSNIFDETKRVLNGGDYNNVLRAVDRLRYVVYNNATRHAIDDGLTFRAAMDRSFGAIRAEKWSNLMRTIENDLVPVIDEALRSGKRDLDGFTMPIIKAIEARLGVNNPWTEQVWRSNIDEIIPFETADNLSGTLATGEKTIKSTGRVLSRRGVMDLDVGDQATVIAERIADRIRNVTHEAMVENGEFPGLTWTDLMRAQVEEGLPVPIYYPHIDTTGATADVVMGTSKSRIIDAPTNRMKKWGGWLYERGTYERNPIKAYEQLFHQIARHNEFRDTMLMLVRKYGRKVDPDELAAWNLRSPAEVLVTENGLKGMLNSRTKLMSLTHENVMRGDSLEQASLKALKSVIDDTVEGFGEGMRGDTIWALPRHVAEKMKRSAHIDHIIPGTFNFYYDTAMGLWKAQVLKLSPRWVVNNTLGNIVMMGIQNPGAIRHFIAQLMPGGEARARVMLGDDLIDAVQRDFMHTETLLPQNERLALRAEKAGVEAGTRFAEGRLATSPTVQKLRAIPEGMTRLNTYVEDAARRGVAINALSKQRMRGLVGRFESTRKRLERLSEGGIPSHSSFDSLVSEVNGTLGDYLTMSPIEGQIIRRYAVPFYAFYRHAVKLLARMPFEHPLKMRVLEQINEIDRQMNPYMPEYMQGSFEIWDGMWARFGGANPLEAVTSDAYWPSMANPLLGLGVQRVTGTNPFGRPWYPPPGQVVETIGGDQYAVMRDGEGRVTGIRQMEGNWQPPLAESLLGAFLPQAQYLTDPFNKSVPEQALSNMLGVSLNDTYDPQTEAYYQTRDYLDALRRAVATPPS